jgi:hypothetical protein
MDYDRVKNIFSNRKIEKTTVPEDKLLFPNKVNMYYSHLASLSLVMGPVYKSDPIFDDDNLQTGIRHQSKWILTEFGKFFVDACVPEGGFRNR